jgi:hypothetical protein
MLVMTCFLTISATAAPVFNPATGHYYEAIYVAPGGSGITWDDAKAATESLSYNGWRGYLATVTSQSENDFLVSTFGTATLHGYWLGGFQPAGSTEPDGNWQWVTGEAWSYTNWQPGEPNNYYMGEWGGPPEGSSENALHYQYANNTGHLAWNDFPDGAYGTGYIVEYSPEPTVEMTIDKIVISLEDGKFKIKGHLDITDPDFENLLLNPQSRLLLELQTGGTEDNPEFGIAGEDKVQLLTKGKHRKRVIFNLQH